MVPFFKIYFIRKTIGGHEVCEQASSPSNGIRSFGANQRGERSSTEQVEKLARPKSSGQVLQNMVESRLESVSRMGANHMVQVLKTRVGSWNPVWGQTEKEPAKRSLKNLA